MTNEEIEKAAHAYACRNGANPDEHGYGGVYKATTDDFKAGAAYVIEHMKDTQAANRVLADELVGWKKKCEQLKETVFKLEQENTACWTQREKLEARCSRYAKALNHLMDRRVCSCSEWSISKCTFCICEEALKSAGEEV